MRTVAFTAAVLLCVFWAPQWAGAQQTTTKGEIVDVLCYQEKGTAAGTGVAHMDCARECARKPGHLFGILTDGDGLFKIIGDYAGNNHAKLLDYIGKQVEVSGVLTRGLDYSTAINVTKITALAVDRK